MMKFYLRMEGVNLFSFISDTQQLSVIRGGSLLLREAVNRVADRFQNLQVVSKGASVGLFTFESADECAAAKMRDTVDEFLYMDTQLKHTTFVVDVVKAGEIQPDASLDEANQYRLSRERLIALNRWRQMRQPTLAVPAQNSANGITYCSVNNVRPATTELTLRGGKVSQSVESRFKYGQEHKKKFYEQEVGINLDFVHDLTTLTEDESKGNLNHKMAVIYVDGNRFSKLLNGFIHEGKGADAETIHHNFDQQLAEYRRGFLTSLLTWAKRGDEGWLTDDQKVRLETLLWGGDEFILVVPAWKGWEVLTHFFAESQDWEFRVKRLTHAAGVVFCHHSAPIHRITALARQLADDVVKQSFPSSDPKDASNAFAYQILESFDHVGRELTSFRKERTPNYEQMNRLIVPADDLREMQARLSKLKRAISRGQLHRIVYAIATGQDSAKEIKDFLKGEDGKQAVQEVVWLEQYLGCHNNSAGGEVPADTSPCSEALWVHLFDLWDYLD